MRKLAIVLGLLTLTLTLGATPALAAIVIMSTSCSTPRLGAAYVGP